MLVGLRRFESRGTVERRSGERGLLDELCSSSEGHDEPEPTVAKLTLSIPSGT